MLVIGMVCRFIDFSWYFCFDSQNRSDACVFIAYSYCNEFPTYIKSVFTDSLILVVSLTTTRKWTIIFFFHVLSERISTKIHWFFHIKKKRVRRIYMFVSLNSQGIVGMHEKAETKLSAKSFGNTKDRN